MFIFNGLGSLFVLHVLIRTVVDKQNNNKRIKIGPFWVNAEMKLNSAFLCIETDQDCFQFKHGYA